MPGTHRRVVWAPKAKQDLREIWRHYAREASPEIADRILLEIAQTGDRLEAQALMWRARDESGARRVRLENNVKLPIKDLPMGYVDSGGMPRCQ